MNFETVARTKRIELMNGFVRLKREILQKGRFLSEKKSEFFMSKFFKKFQNIENFSDFGN